ncbi:MAG: response regulator [Gammaproteobacteria bacterium]
MISFRHKLGTWRMSFDPGQSRQTKEFLLLFIPITVLIGAGTWLLGESRLKAEMSTQMAEERTYVDLALGRLDQELAVPIRHLVSLVNEKPVRQVYESADTTDPAQMEEAFFSLLSRNPDYDQARWIDQKGLERVRVNNRDGKQVLVPQDQLQDKHERYFFIDTMQLASGVIFVSPLDLNADNGQIERPFKPTIRVAMRVFDTDGNGRGILIINIAARSMLSAFVSSSGPAADRVMLLNNEGYWLKSPDEADEWGFMFHRNLTMAERNPAVWREMSTQESGQIRLSDGIWTWNSVTPVPDRDMPLSHDIHWKVVTHLPADRLLAMEKQIWPRKIFGALLLLFLFGVGIKRLVQAKAASARAEQKAALALSEAEASHRLQEAQAGFRMLFEASTSGLLVVDASGRITTANPAFEAMFGYALSELLRQPVEMLLPDPVRKQHAEWRSEYLRHPVSRSMGANRDLYGTRKDGTTFPIEIGLSPYRDNNRAFVLATIVDISERKRVQDEIIKMNETLEQRVVERTEELEVAKLEAERLANTKGNFVANMSHEIRTPMNAILGMAYLLEKGRLGDEERDMVKKIRVAGRSLLGIINDILDFSKIESGRLEIEHAPYRLNDVLDNVATLMSAVEHKQDVELIIGPAPQGMECLCGDALRVEQILVNLASNALKFTERGCVTITVQRAADAGGQERLRFSVKDTGKGIAREKQAEIFNAFSQEDTSTTRCFGGTGLGLSICRSLVDKMGGEIGVISELGKGSEFWFVLPVERLDQQDYVQPALAFQNVLIADDHPVAREILAVTVRSLGWNPDIVCSGEDAVERFMERAQNNKLPDVVLLDWRMPGMDGLEAARRIREFLGDMPNAPIVVIATSYDRESLKHEKGMEVADAILSKPITASALYNAVSDAKQRCQSGSDAESVSITVLGDGRLHSLRVLVVDDSEINRDMARRILESENAVVELADDGQSAVAWLRANPGRIDVVLMDIQMPLMDGYEATRLIREDLGLASLPVIALTAGAFKNQQVAALQAGMNGFVAKPFDVDELISLLQRYAVGQRQEQAFASPERPLVAIESRVTPIIDIERVQRNWGNVEILHKYLRKFADTHGGDGSEIERLISSGEVDGAKALAHKLKGVASNLAIIKVWELAEKIETLLADGRSSGDLPQSLQMALDEAIAEIARLDAAIPAEEEIFCINDNPLPLLSDLLTALDQDNPDAAEPSLLALERILPVQSLKPIREMLESFDFRAAETETKALMKEFE